jgi:hypothetical protein
MSEINYDEVVRTLEGIRDAAQITIKKLQHAHSPLPGSYCVHCGETINGVNGLEECPVSRYMSRLGHGSLVNDPIKGGDVHGQPHLWSAGHVEDWFNYSGPRGAEKGFGETA